LATKDFYHIGGTKKKSKPIILMRLRNSPLTNVVNKTPRDFLSAVRLQIARLKPVVALSNPQPFAIKPEGEIPAVLKRCRPLMLTFWNILKKCQERHLSGSMSNLRLCLLFFGACCPT